MYTYTYVYIDSVAAVSDVAVPQVHSGGEGNGKSRYTYMCGVCCGVCCCICLVFMYVCMHVCMYTHTFLNLTII